MATIAGALGTSVEDEETVREAAYDYRLRRRSEADDFDNDDFDDDWVNHQDHLGEDPGRRARTAA